MRREIKRITLGVLTCLIGIVCCVSLTSCSTKYTKIGIPNDATNQGRAIKLLESSGFIEVDSAAGYTPELKDITKYNYNIEIIPTDANTLTTLLGDYAACIINGTFATAYGFIPSKDALAIEKQVEGSTNPYINIICSKAEDKDNATYKKVVEAYQTQTVAEYLLAKYNEAYFPAFSYNAPSTTDIVSTIDSYTSTKSGKTVVKVGVCGAANDYWKAVQKVLDDNGDNIYIELTQFSSYTVPNEALNSGDIDLNAFQHYAYFENDCNTNSYELTAIGETLIAPLSLYSSNADSLDSLKTLVGEKSE